MRRRRIAALIICALFAFVLFSSLTLAVVHSFHECPGETCPICRTIHQTEALLKLFYAGCFLASSALVASHLIVRTPVCGISLPRPTLISMKVKLTD